MDDKQSCIALGGGRGKKPRPIAEEGFWLGVNNNHNLLLTNGKKNIINNNNMTLYLKPGPMKTRSYRTVTGCRR